MSVTIDPLQFSRKQLKTLLADPEKSARAVDLVYVKDVVPGIERRRIDSGFEYLIGRRKIKSKSILARIKQLAIPPAWESVWICQLENGHLQATGLDLRQRKQYRYHPLWNELRNHTKFYRLHEFGRTLPAIRTQLERDLRLPGLPVEKVLAAVVSLMEQTSIRIGNTLYEKLYGSFGLTTLKDKHVKISGQQLQFIFKGKKGIAHNISIKSKRLAKIVQACRDIPGKELFQYYDDQGEHRSIDSGMVNTYLKNISGQDFTAKDFRTWAGSVRALIGFLEIARADTQAEVKKNILQVLDQVAAHLGNTRAVCRKYYVHPALIALYEQEGLHHYLKELQQMAAGEQTSALVAEEQLLMKILAR